MGITLTSVTQLTIMTFGHPVQLIPISYRLGKRTELHCLSVKKLLVLFNETTATVLMYIFSEVKQIAFLQEC